MARTFAIRDTTYLSPCAFQLERLHNDKYNFHTLLQNNMFSETNLPSEKIVLFIQIAFLPSVMHVNIEISSNSPGLFVLLHFC